MKLKKLKNNSTGQNWKKSKLYDCPNADFLLNLKRHTTQIESKINK
jgi:hypothetical protein